ncbi:MAG: hypothetical protein HYV77_04450 [Candidatus Wildermuthbacteria bacterium]|nr:hypothetical protein [Candidatus Wildermuthbacteria bacterium]
MDVSNLEQHVVAFIAWIKDASTGIVPFNYIDPAMREADALYEILLEMARNDVERRQARVMYEQHRDTLTGGKETPGTELIVATLRSVSRTVDEKRLLGAIHERLSRRHENGSGYIVRVLGLEPEVRRIGIERVCVIARIFYEVIHQGRRLGDYKIVVYLYDNGAEWVGIDISGAFDHSLRETLKYIDLEVIGGHELATIEKNNGVPSMQLQALAARLRGYQHSDVEATVREILEDRFGKQANHDLVLWNN